MEPQPLSFQIKQLEREIGFALLSHRENRTYLTAAGSAFLQDAEEILASADRAVEHGARVARGEAGLLRVGSVSPLSLFFLAPAIKQFRTSLPDVSFAVHTLRTGELEHALNRQELDLGFTLLPVPDDNFDSLAVSRARPVVAVAADDPLAQHDRVQWHQLDGHHLIRFEDEPAGYQRRLDAMLADHGIQLPTAQQADSIEAALAFVGVGLGFALLHLFVQPEARKDVRFLCLPDDAPEADFGALWRRDDPHPLRARFLEVVATIAGSEERLHTNGRAHRDSASL